MTNNSPDISFITICYNGFKDTCELIESLHKKLKSVSYEIIVVDNASREDEAAKIHELYPTVISIRSNENGGFSGGNNIGIRAAKGKYIFLINNDTYIESDEIAYLVERLESRPEIGGNGAFWTIKYFNAGQGIKWASEKSDAESFASLGTNVNYVVGSNGRATVETSGLYLVYVDMNRNLIAFEKPAVYGIGECFDGQEVSFDLSGQNFSAVTTTQGNLQMYATSDYNNRDWNTMEFNIYNGQIYYRGVGAALEPVPVASNIPIELDFSQDRGKIAVTFASPSDVPSTAKAIYMVGDEFGNMNWGSDGVISLDKVWNSADRWIHINYFNAGTKLRFSTSKIFGDGEFTGLTNNVGFEISDEGLVVIPQSGTYIIFVDLGSKTISIQKPVIYGYGTAAGGNNEKILPFTESSDGKTFSVTLPNGGRFRIHPYIPAFDNLNPSFGAWKREYAVNPETLEIYLRKEGMDEPNKDYVWAANTIITLDFRAAKGTIVVP